MLAKEFNGYTFYENGKVCNKNGNEVQKRINNGKYEIRLVTNKGRQNFIFARLYYHLFIDEFDMNNKDLCVSTKDGNHLNVTIDNLILVPRKDLIQGDKHKTRAKLTNSEVKEIKATYEFSSNQHNKTGMSYNDLAKKYGVTKGEIALVIQGRARNEMNYKLK